MKCKVLLQKQFLPIVANHWKSDFSTVTRAAGSEEYRQMCSTEILLNTATIREVNSTEIDSGFTKNCTGTRLFAIAVPSYTQSKKISQFQKTLIIEFTNGGFPCHLNVISTTLPAFYHECCSLIGYANQ